MELVGDLDEVDQRLAAADDEPEPGRVVSAQEMAYRRALGVA